MATKRKYLVEVREGKEVYIRTATASSRSSAVRQVLRTLIGSGSLKKQPETVDGWWNGVSCECLK